ncbi:CRISPR-associated protein Csx10 [Ectothiorhodospira mobilis]|uniref:CRISPR-associated protein Csx10 n=1 Tax=Ectothiorhodospira mobilis TaxID=195064 RepID=A0A1I4RVB0_ECTMO|nr:hypothetical protein [Ectothiorhodospira mobilis]SFM56162.1 CRISPR-associated protein Csx10 [Ectothiorhodospira mobilis]
MRTQGIRITLEEDCVFSASTATEGGHEGLDRVPGQALLGAAAARLYAKLDRADAFTLFHSGKVRFGDGLPAAGDEAAGPMPLSWHHPKEEKPEGGDGRLHPERVYNFCHVRALGNDRQPAQLRGGYVRADGLRLRPQREFRLKTAIDPHKGRAKDSQLFGYDALLRGQTFLARVDADDDVDPALVERALAVLNGECLLGRSRSAEYGRARLEPVDIPLPKPGEAGTRLVLWLLSDLALLDEAGQPTLEPDPALLGLGPGKVDWRATFVRSRRYAPWNAHRRGYDREREVLVAGSVVTVDLDEPPSAEALERLATGVGLYREGGLGRILANPALLDGEHPSFTAPAEAGGADEIRRPADPLLDWLEAISGGRGERLDRMAREIAAEIAGRIAAARRFAGVSAGQRFGPSRSQWGQVGQLARRRPPDLMERLFQRKDALIRMEKAGWKDVIPPGAEGGEWLTLAEWLEQRFGTLDGEERADLVARVAHMVREETEKNTDQEAAQ